MISEYVTMERSGARFSRRCATEPQGHLKALPTPFDMVVLNKMSRIHLCMDADRHAPNLANAGELLAKGEALLAQHRAYVQEHYEDLPEIRDWVWSD